MRLSETVIFVFMIRAIAGIRSAITSPYPHAVDAVQNIPLFINLSTDVFFSRGFASSTCGEKKQFSRLPT